MERESTKHGPLRDADVPARLAARLASVPAERPFASVHEVMVCRPCLHVLTGVGPGLTGSFAAGLSG
jgi:hypothetical protein